MIGDLLLDRGDRRELPLGDQPGQQLGVVDDLVVPAELRVLVRERVEAVRAARDDRPRGRLVERLDVLLSEHGEHELVAHPPGGIAGAGLGGPEHGELHARPCAAAWRSPWWSCGPGPPAPPRSRPRTGTRRRRGSSRPRPAPRSPARRSTPPAAPRPCPTGRPCSPGSSASPPPRWGRPTRSAPGNAACRRCGRCARCQPGIPARRRRSWCTTRSRPGRSRRPAAGSPTSGRSASCLTSSGSASRSSSLDASR